MQENCLQRISLWLFCYSVHTGLSPGLINLSYGRPGCGMSAQLSPPRCGQSRSDRGIWANYASHSWELGLITAEWSTTELWDERTGQLLIYSAQAVIAKVSRCPACLVSPPWEACPPQQHSSSRQCWDTSVQCSFVSPHNPHTEHQTQPLLTPRGCSKGSFPFHLPLFSVHQAPRLLSVLQSGCDATLSTRASLGSRSSIITSAQAAPK